MAIEINSEDWVSLVDNIAGSFTFKEIITHEHLKKSFGMEDLTRSIHEDIGGMLKAIDMQRIEYTAYIQQLRADLLEMHQLYLESRFSAGYWFTPPEEQQKLAFKKTKKEVNKSLNQGINIARNVRFDLMTDEQRRVGSDYSVKLSMLDQMIKTARR